MGAGTASIGAMNTAPPPGRERFILVAVAEPAAHPEAVHVAAAAGRPLLDLLVDVEDEAERAAELARHLPRAAAVILDAAAAADLDAVTARPGVFAVAADPGPAPEVEVGGALVPGFVVPAQSPELLAALGAALRGATSAPVDAAGTDSTRARPGRAPHDGTSERDGRRRGVGNRQGPGGGDAPRAPRAAAEPGRGRVLGVAGACGGAGASTLAAACAVVAAADGTAALVDAVANSGGLDLLTGDEDTTGLRWGDVDFTRGEIPAGDLVEALPETREGVWLLTAGRSVLAAAAGPGPGEVVAALGVLRREAATVVVDLPPWGPMTDEVSDACDLVVVLTPAEVRPTAAAARLCARLESRRTGACVLVRHRGWSSLTLDDVAGLTRARVLGELPTHRGLARRAELGGLGGPPRGLARVAGLVLDELRGAR